VDLGTIVGCQQAEGEEGSLVEGGEWEAGRAMAAKARKGSCPLEELKAQTQYPPEEMKMFQRCC